MKAYTVNTYNVGDVGSFPCGCAWRKDKQGFTHFIHPDCPFDNRPHTKLQNYHYEMMPVDTVDSCALHFLKGGL